ncbi:type I restriction-modification system, S subunit, partial [Prevotella sp. oral taxon 472 str. F0295]
MNGKQLKNSILQWAIQGKLVPQDPNDEPASVLLEKIRQEKERLIKEKKIKRDKNASIIYRGEDNSYYEKFADGKVVCIDEEIPFEIPQGWEWCRLRDIIEGTNAGKSPNCEKRPKKEYEWGVLTTTAIQENVFLPTENKVLPPNYIVNSEHSVQYGDILITRAGPVNRTGVVCLVDKECGNLILSDKTVRIDYLRNYCNPIFIVLVLNSPAIHELLMSVTVGMA